MSKQMKTLNNNKIKHKFSKTNLFGHNQAFCPSPTKGSNLPLANKARKQKLQFETQNTILSLKPPKSWPLANVPLKTQLYHPKIQLFCIIIRFITFSFFWNSLALSLSLSLPSFSLYFVFTL